MRPPCSTWSIRSSRARRRRRPRSGSAAARSARRRRPADRAGRAARRSVRTSRARAVMTGSRVVQSALSRTTPLRAKASVTALERSATRSLTRQVRHQAAVTFTKTGLPAARSSASRCGAEGLPARASARAGRAAVRPAASESSAAAPTAPTPSATTTAVATRRQGAPSVARDSIEPHREGDQHQSGQRRRHAGRSGLLAHDPHEPGHRGVERKRQGLLEPRHPGAGRRQQHAATPGRA